MRYVALLRGINVGGRHTLPMVELALLCERAGGRDVVTYIQSGNVLFTATAAAARALPAKLARAIQRARGFQAPVVVRTAAQLRGVVDRNPFVKQGTPLAHLSVAFLADAPKAAARRALDPRRSPPDAFELAGRELYLYCPRGLARTKLTTAYFDATLGTTSTLRNWKTVLKLAELVAAS